MPSRRRWGVAFLAGLAAALLYLAIEAVWPWLNGTPFENVALWTPVAVAGLAGAAILHGDAEADRREVALGSLVGLAGIGVVVGVWYSLLLVEPAGGASMSAIRAQGAFDDGWNRSRAESTLVAQGFEVSRRSDGDLLASRSDPRVEIEIGPRANPRETVHGNASFGFDARYPLDEPIHADDATVLHQRAEELRDRFEPDLDRFLQGFANRTGYEPREPVDWEPEIVVS